jgi:acetolactate synthase-1/2/3 large subunit
MAARDVLEEDGIDVGADMKKWAPIAPMGLDNESVELLTDALIKAKNPLIITSYLGRNTESVGELVKLCDRLSIPVTEMVPPYMNFPTNHPMHMGGMAHPLVKEADLILSIDCDLPWTPAMTKPQDDCRVFCIDVDPIKEDIPVWYIPAERFIRADSYTALKQINARLEQGGAAPDPAVASARREKLGKMKAEMDEQRKAQGKQQSEMTAGYVSACLREIVDDDTIILNEALSGAGTVTSQIPRTKPGTLFGCGGSSLAWFGGAAISVKLANPDKDFVATAGDGVYIFSCPTAVYWMARRYKTPFLTVIYNNQGWNAPKMITRGQHPDGYAARDNKYWASFEQPARLDLVAEAAGGAFARTVEKPEDLPAALREGMDAVHKGIPAVINVILPPV